MAQKRGKRMINEKNSFAVVGASNNKNKFGYKIFELFLKKKYVVFAVNPKTEEILNQKVYANISSLPIVPDVVVTVVPPEVTEKIVDEAIKIGVKTIWMQPGSESQKAIDNCKKNKIKCIYGACIVVDGLKIEF